MPPSGGGGSFDSGTPQPTSSSGYQTAYQPIPGQASGQVPQGNQYYALQRVSGPAVSLIVTSVLALGLHMLGLMGTMLKVGVAAAAMNQHAMPGMFISGPIAIINQGINIILYLIILIGAIKMKGLENYGFAMTVSIIALIPCISPCCILGLPFGIWSLVVLSDPIVKSSFKS
jgi:hypothetical protein